jgi:hypothetical protein
MSFALQGSPRLSDWSRIKEPSFMTSARMLRACPGRYMSRAFTRLFVGSNGLSSFQLCGHVPSGFAQIERLYVKAACGPGFRDTWGFTQSSSGNSWTADGQGRSIHLCSPGIDERAGAARCEFQSIGGSGFEARRRRHVAVQGASLREPNLVGWRKGGHLPMGSVLWWCVSLLWPVVLLTRTLTNFNRMAIVSQPVGHIASPRLTSFSGSWAGQLGDGVSRPCLALEGKKELIANGSKACNQSVREYQPPNR